jgi:release factor glutamine methyltransferase
MTNNRYLGDWVSQSARQLMLITDTPQLEAQLLAAFVFNRDRSWLMAHLDQIPNLDQDARLEAVLNERLQLVPLPYIIGEWSFYGLDFHVSPAVLIPRPETELLVSEAIGWLQNYPARTHCVDVGTGSGCIAVSLAVNLPRVTFVCVDISLPALIIARRNAVRHQVEGQLVFVQSDLLSPFKTPFDMICANLPYIPTRTLESLPVRLHEPASALDGGPDGLDLIRRLLAQSLSRIAPGGLLLFEIEAGQGESALQLARETFPQARCQIMADLAGLPRLLRIEVQ